VSPSRCGSLHARFTPEGIIYYFGIDLYKDDSRVAVLNDDSKIVNEARVQNASLEQIAEEYTGSKAAIEATSNYYTVYDTLKQYLDVVVADPTQTKAIGYAEVKNDRLDARLLAQLRRAGMIAESYVPPEELREHRALVRGRKRLRSKSTPTSRTKFTRYSIRKVFRTIGTRSVLKNAKSSPARISLSGRWLNSCWNRFSR
jgi:hypothetical protein